MSTKVEVKEVRTPKGNIAHVRYQYEGIPTDGLFPLYQGYTRKDQIIIQPHLEEDKGLLLHELTHVDQYLDSLFFSKRYKFCKSFRLKVEAEAFAAQLKGDESKVNLKKYACELSAKYSIDKTEDECATLIMQFYEGQK